MELLITIVSFVLALGILITVHEYGHYRVARWAGVKVLRFSVGFGKPLYKRTYGNDNTEFVLASIPLGGYVKMLDEREGEVADVDLPRAFNRQSLGARVAIVAAGPLVNLAFALFAWWAVYVLGVSGLQPVVGQVPEGSPASAAGFQVKDEILAINGEKTPTWDIVFPKIFSGIIDDEAVDVSVRTEAGDLTQRRLYVDGEALNEDPAKLIAQIGLRPWIPPYPIVLSEVTPGPAREAGLRSGDKVIAMDGEPVEDWGDMVAYVNARAGRDIRFRIERGGKLLTFDIVPAEVETSSGKIGRIGVRARAPKGLLDRFRREVRYGPIEAISLAAIQLKDSTLMMIKMLGRLISGNASVKNISGPISIAQIVGNAANRGLARFLEILAMVSLTLGIMNLLPIPVLDGGHLLYYLVEFLRGGRALSEEAQLIGQKVGITLLLGLMSLAFYNDFARLLG